MEWLCLGLLVLFGLTSFGLIAACHKLEDRQ